MYGRILKYLTPYWKHILASAVSMICFAALSGALVWMIGPMMGTLFEYNQMAQLSHPGMAPSGPAVSDSTAQGGPPIVGAFARVKESLKRAVNGVIFGATKLETLRNLCLAVLLIAILKAVFFYLQGYFLAFVEQRFIRNLRLELFTHYQKLSLSYFHGTRTGQLISHVTNDVMVLRESVDQSFNRMFRDPLLVLLYLAFMFIISWKLMLVAVTTLPLTFVLMYLIGRKLRRYSARAQARMADVNTVLDENVTNIRIVKGFNTDAFEIGKFTKQADAYFRTLLKISRVRLSSNPINELLGTLATVIILWFGGQQVLGHVGLSAADFTLFAFAMFSLIAPVKSLSNLHIIVQEGMAAAERIFQVLDTPVEVKEAPDARELQRFERELRFEDVHFSYPTTPDVLKQVSFSVRRGELVAIVGPSGAGKSTLCDLIPRFYDPQQGRITIDGIDLKQLKLSSLRALLGLVTQETMLFNDTIYNNITYGLNGVAREKVVEASQVANAYDFIMGFELGFETPIGNRGVMLSGGQRQRLAIARAILRDPQILIFDEATSSLDTESEKLVQDAIDRLLQGRTTFVIAHRLSTVLHADKILVIDGGRLVEAGTHSELLAHGGVYRRLYDLQFREQNPHGA